MNKREIIEKLKDIKDDINVIICFAGDPYYIRNYREGELVSKFYETYEDLPTELADVMKCLIEDFKDMTMREFAKMD